MFQCSVSAVNDTYYIADPIGGFVLGHYLIYPVLRVPIKFYNHQLVALSIFFMVFGFSIMCLFM